MAKKEVKEKAKGIWDGLKESDENESKKEEKSKGIKEQKNKSSKVEKKKRSFMLENSQIEKLYLLKARNNDMTLSEIVGNAIDDYYEEHKV
jgi:hypothetical protein